VHDVSAPRMGGDDCSEGKEKHGTYDAHAKAPRVLPGSEEVHAHTCYLCNGALAQPRRGFVRQQVSLFVGVWMGKYASNGAEMASTRDGDAWGAPCLQEKGRSMAPTMRKRPW
jgi:hypothetical protein